MIASVLVPEGRQMGEKDIAEKILESYNDVFADLVNGCLFDGRQVAREEDFVDATPYGYYKASGRIREQSRDVAKYWKKGGIVLSLVGLENQTEPDPYMPIRVMSYDAAAYRAQLSDDALNRPYPVMTLVVYLGYKSRWNKPLSVKGCLVVPTEMDGFVHDYGMNLYQIAWMSREEIDRRFHGDFWIVADYFWQKRVYHDYRPSKKRFRHVRETLELLQIMEKDDRYETECQDMIENPDWKEGWNMCDVLDRVENRGLERGLERGIEQGRAEGAQGMRREGFTLEQIAKVYRTDVQTVVGMLREP